MIIPPIYSDESRAGGIGAGCPNFRLHLTPAVAVLPPPSDFRLRRAPVFTELRRGKSARQVGAARRVRGARPSRSLFATSRCKHSSVKASGATPSAACGTGLRSEATTRQAHALPAIAPRRQHHGRCVCGDDERHPPRRVAGLARRGIIDASQSWRMAIAMRSSGA